jgi:hypothetical protein
LHVLSTPPAFVLSQDQTLRGKFSSSEIPLEVSGRVQAVHCSVFKVPGRLMPTHHKIKPKKIR